MYTGDSVDPQGGRLERSLRHHELNIYNNEKGSGASIQRQSAAVGILVLFKKPKLTRDRAQRPASARTAERRGHQSLCTARMAGTERHSEAFKDATRSQHTAETCFDRQKKVSLPASAKLDALRRSLRPTSRPIACCGWPAGCEVEPKLTPSTRISTSGLRSSPDGRRL